MPRYRGFILQPTHRIENGRPLVHLYGRLEEGRPFLVRDGRAVPHFYVTAREAAKARELGAVRQTPTDQVTLAGEPVVRVELDTPSDAPPLRDRLAAGGVASCEADVRFAARYLIDRGLRGSVEISGKPREVPGLGLVFDDPDVGPGEWTPTLSVLSLDIETDPQAQRLLSVGLHGCGASEVLLLTPAGASCPGGARGFPTERALLTGFALRVRDLDPDVLTGWNVVDFDLAVLARLAAAHGVSLEFGRGPGALRLRASGFARGAAQASVPGRIVLDGIQLLRSSFIRMDDYGLDAVARSVLGEGKTLHAAGKAAEILRLFEQDRPRFVEYNRTDARLALEILEKKRLVELSVARSQLTGLPPDRVAGSIAAFDLLYLSELKRHRVVAPSVRDAPASEPQGGGHVLESLPGLYTNVVVLDFRSLYPSLIRTFEIDPWSLALARAGATGADNIVAPNGAAFSRRKAILGAILDELMPRREAARRAGDEVKSHAIKILMNSFYGVLGTPSCRFYDPRLANAITSFGRELLLWCKGRIEQGGGRVLYGDTDSLFVETGIADVAAARRFGQDLAARLTGELSAHIAERWRVESRLDLVFERLYRRLCLPAMRHDATGARKRYAGLVDGPDGARLVFTGMEAVRSDWTALAKTVQRELYARLFADEGVLEYLTDVVKRLRAGEFDDQLVYRKALRKPPAAYTSTTPPHVAVARGRGQKRGRVAYVITTAGPRPAGDARAPLDYEHYLGRQIGAVAEPVLSLLGLDMERVLGRQLRLF
jgi:DNA polymerase II